MQVNIQADTNGQLQSLSSVYPVKRGEAVDFVVQDPVQVVVSFDRGSCLTESGPFYLDGSDPAKAGTGPISVSPDASGRYPFTVAPDTRSGSGKSKGRPGDHEAKQGELDVSTDY
ncbi:Hypothetical protein AA314_09969 [Archangium gephyra]|uniref:Uncharacterized protein n=1 Tax=Archangium gephyra TaxID=48 RepID=A0AAC8QIJ8_9BACT|nr:Hypothetical protein AA314_09969 [Archangium gephyra]